jgi:hypothetical protein
VKWKPSRPLCWQLPLAEIERVTFFKRDELTTDLICCDVQAVGRDWFFHEEMVGWELLLDRLKGLPGFRTDWFSAISQPAFVSAETVAFQRH